MLLQLLDKTVDRRHARRDINSLRAMSLTLPPPDTMIV